jgi:RNA polymerase sigma factor (sigma-70 family)
MIPDAELLHRYVGQRAEAAFAELVHRHLRLVYGTALRRTNGDSHLAEEVAQEVFADLARHAPALQNHPVLGGWLYVTTRHAAASAMRAEQRRKAREEKAHAMRQDEALPAAENWDSLRPELDSLLDELDGRERDIVLLRFFDEQPFAEIGAALRISEDAARMRVERALDKLRTLLARRGVTSTTAALGLALTARAAVTVPSGLATTLSAQSLALASGVGGAVSLGSLMTTKSIIAAGIVAAIGIGLGIFLRDREIVGGRILVSTPAAPPALMSELDSLQRSNRSLRAESERLSSEIARLSAANAELTAQVAAAAAKPAPVKPSPILGWGAKKWEQQEQIMAYLRQVDAARNQAIFDGKPASSVRDLTGTNGYIRSIRPLANEDYTELSMEKGKPLTVTTADGMTVTYDPSGATTTPIDYPPEIQEVRKLEERAQELSQKGNAARQKAIEAYRAANQGRNPPPQNPQALLPYFATSQDGADFVEFMEAQQAAARAMKAATSKAQ